MKTVVLILLLSLLTTGCGSVSDNQSEAEDNHSSAEIVESSNDVSDDSASVETIIDWLTKKDNYLVVYNYASPQIYDFYNIEFEQLKPIDESYLVYKDYKNLLDDAGYTQEKIFAIRNYRHSWGNSKVLWNDLTSGEYSEDNNWNSNLVIIFSDDRDNCTLTYYLSTINQSPSQENYEEETDKMFLLNREFSMT